MLSLLRKLNRPVYAVLAVALIAGGIRFVHLSYPPTRVFDEVYYSKAGCLLVGYSWKQCDVTSSDERYWARAKDDVGSWVHPPLGKWAIGLGEKVFGTGPFGWRVASALFGTLSVVFLALIAQLLWGSALWTFVAGLLLATEGLNVVQSRMSMLDIFIAFWAVLGFFFLLLDRRWIERRTPPPPPPQGPAEQGESLEGELAPPRPKAVPAPFWRPWRFAAGVAFGGAFATKWSGFVAILSAVFLSYIWELSRNKRAGVKRWGWRVIQAETFGIVLAFLAVPALVYFASYAGWFVHFGFHLFGDNGWFKLQGDMVSYHEHLTVIDPTTHKPVHPYLSQSWKWILLWRPVLYYAKYLANDVRHMIIGLGSPTIFWGSILAVPYLFWSWWKHKDWRAGFVLVAMQYLPWAIVSRPQFFFYVTPVTPFFALACAYAVRDLAAFRYRIPDPVTLEGGETIAYSRSRPFLPVAVGFVVLSVALFAFFWPVLTGGPLSAAAWKLRIWFPSWV